MSDKTVIFEGPVRTIGQGYNSFWEDSYLKLYSDGSLAQKTPKGEERPIKFSPFVTTDKSTRVNYPEVFTINTVPEGPYSSGPLFAAPNAKTAEEWIYKINCAQMKRAASLKHPHPLTKLGANEQPAIAITETQIWNEGNTYKCYLCDSDVYEGLSCEFCEFVLCNACATRLKTFVPPLRKSENHEHELMMFPKANYPMYFPSEYNGAFVCDKCKKDCDGAVYHCLDCGVYDECPDCMASAASGPSATTENPVAPIPSTTNTTQQTLPATNAIPFEIGQILADAVTNPTTPKKIVADSTVTVQNNPKLNENNARPLALDVGVLASHVEVKGNAFKLLAADNSKFPRAASMIAARHWDLSKIEQAPVPHAYFEVTFDSFMNQSDLNCVGIGIGNQIFTQNQLLGCQQNSFGYFNDGTLAHNTSYKHMKYLPEFNPGDTIGAGILFDSFNQRRLFFTKNGKLVEYFPSFIHKGMDCFPGVSFTKNSRVSFAVNFNGPFKFDINTLPNHRNDKTDHLTKSPMEILVACIAHAAETVAFAAQLRLVCKTFSRAALDNAVWQPLVLKRWPRQQRKLKLKSWYNLYKQRGSVEKVPRPGGQSFIENCDFEFQCPLIWESLKSGSNPDERFCDKCQKTVYSVSDDDTLHKYAAMGRCVSFVVKPDWGQPPMPPFMQRLGGAPMPPPRVIPPPFQHK